jgi:hypothetical protein
MNDAWTDAIKEAFAIAPATSFIYETLEIHQEDVQRSIRIVKARQGITATDENGDTHFYEPVGFQITLPPSNEEGFRSINVAVDNVSRRISDFINLAKSAVIPVKVIYRPFLSNDLSAPQMDPPLVLYLKDVQVTAMQVTGRATFMDVVNMKFPSQLYTRDRFPSLG